VERIQIIDWIPYINYPLYMGGIGEDKKWIIII
jgi:hypothetical protein